MSKLLLFAIIFVFIITSVILVVNKKPLTQTDQLGLSTYSTVTPVPTSTQNTPTPTPATTSASITPITQTSITKVILKTSKGDIEIELYTSDAPKTVANFLKKSSDGFYNNLTFHRVEDWVIQGGDPLGNGTGGGNMPVEFNAKPFVTGSVGVASRGDGIVQNDSQFFITKTEASWLNGQYTNFGIVTKGMDVVNKIAIGDKIVSIRTR